MKNNVLLASLSVVILATESFAGGNIVPVVEPIPVKKLAIPVYVGAGFTFWKIFFR